MKIRKSFVMFVVLITIASITSQQCEAWNWPRWLSLSLPADKKKLLFDALNRRGYQDLLKKTTLVYIPWLGSNAGQIGPFTVLGKKFFTRKEASWPGILLHENGHKTYHHSAKQMIASLLTIPLLSPLLRQASPFGIGTIVIGRIILPRILAPLSRYHEYQADKHAYTLLKTPEERQTFINHLSATDFADNFNALQYILDPSHPNGIKRAERLENSPIGKTAQTIELEADYENPATPFASIGMRLKNMFPSKTTHKKIGSIKSPFEQPQPGQLSPFETALGKKEFLAAENMIKNLSREELDVLYEFVNEEKRHGHSILMSIVMSGNNHLLETFLKKIPYIDINDFSRDGDTPIESVFKKYVNAPTETEKKQWGSITQTLLYYGAGGGLLFLEYEEEYKKFKKGLVWSIDSEHGLFGPIKRLSTDKLLKGLAGKNLAIITNGLRKALDGPKDASSASTVRALLEKYPSEIKRMLNVQNLDKLGKKVDDFKSTNIPLLSLAAKWGHRYFVQWALLNGANPDLKDNTSKTARDYAYENKFPEIVKMIDNAKKSAIKCSGTKAPDLTIDIERAISANTKFALTNGLVSPKKVVKE